ncbi:hypothetical protein [Streptomyces sp.]|uniref:hypothetical protein n=1 Tax=Streptomyces sp. TaxID=1931 RepID=UPI002F415668
MIETPTNLAGQHPALSALTQIAVSLGHLPAANIDISSVYPDRLFIRLHDNLGAFEAWRDALGIPADAVFYRSGASGMTLKAESRYAAATIELTAQAPGEPRRPRTGNTLRGRPYFRRSADHPQCEPNSWL